MKTVQSRIIVLKIKGMTLDKAIEALIRDRDTIAKEGRFSNVRIEEHPKEYEDGYELCLVGDRAETKKEALNRIAADRQHEEYQRAEYERLKKKFGG